MTQRITAHIAMIIKYLFLQVVVSFTINAHAQEINFAKEQIEQLPEKIYFNVIQIKNSTNNQQRFTIKLDLPENSKVIGFIPPSITANANETKYIPIRLQLPKSLLADADYKVKAHIIAQHQDTTTIVSNLIILANKNLLIEQEQSNQQFTPGNSTIDASISIINKGNVNDEITLSYDHSNEIKIEKIDFAEKKISIKPGEVKRINFKITPHRQYKEKSFDSAKLTVNLQNNLVDKEIKFTVKKLLSEFDFYKTNNRLPDNMVEFFVRENDLEFPERLGVKARGKYIGDKGNIVYRFMTNNIFNTTDFFDNYYIDLGYQSDLLNFGYGTSSTELGEGLFKRHSLYVDKKFNISEQSSIQTFVNSSIKELDTGGAIGYGFSNENIETTNSLAINYNKRETRMVSSFTNATNINLKNSSIDYRGMLSNQTLDDLTGNYNAYEHSMNYSGIYLNNRLRLKASNNFKLMDEDTGLLIYNSAFLNSQYNFAEKWMFTFFGSNNLYSSKLEGNNTSTNSNSLRTMIYFPKINRLSTALGINYSESNRLIGTNQNTDNSYAALFRTNINFFRFKTSNTIEYGLHNSLSLKNPSDYIQLNSRLSYQPFRNTSLQSQLYYAQGEIIKFTEEKTREFRADASVRQSFFDDKLGINAGVNYSSYPRYNTTSLTLNTGIDYTTSNNLKFKMSLKMRKSDDSNILKTSMLEASVAKYFNIGTSKNYFDLTLTFFKDHNSNGILDESEETIEGIQIQLQNPDAKSKIKSLTLVSDHKGTSICKNLPKGNYNLSFISLHDLQGYYNFSGNNSYNFLQDTKLAIPFSKAGKIIGTLSVFKSKFSSLGLIDIANIRVKAIDEDGKTYSGLTDAMGNYTIYVPQNRKYVVSINEIFGSKLELEKNNININFFDTNKYTVNFTVKEKKRRINFSR